MKYFLVGLLVGCAGMAHAETHNIKFLNCSEMKNVPYVCLLNDTDSMITNIDCEEEGSDTKAMAMPKGGIAGHSFTVLNTKVACKGHLVFYLLGGGERKSGPIDTDRASMVEVPLK